MAEWVEERDEDGSIFKTKKYDGRYYVSHFIGNVKDHLSAIDEMVVRDDDTFLLSYPKSDCHAYHQLVSFNQTLVDYEVIERLVERDYITALAFFCRLLQEAAHVTGTHWVFTLARMLRTGDTKYHGSPVFMDFNDMEKLNNLPSPRILATHMTFDRLPRQAREGKGKILAVFRNPKDVIVSLKTFIAKLDHSDVVATWPGLLKFCMEGKMVYGSWFENIQAWDKTKSEKKRDNIMYLIYEDMKQDLRLHVQKMDSFLGTDTGNDFLDMVTDKCTFRNMAAEATKTFTPDDQWKTATDSKTLPIYRKGEIGDWKNHFTVAQNEHFDKVYEEKMKNSSFRFRFE